MRKIYKIARKNIEIISVYNDVHRLCEKYECSCDTDFTIETEVSDIEYERKKADMPNKIYSDGYLETLAVYRKICEQMIRYNIILFHGSAVAVDGKAYLFTAKSGTGKSTHTALWRKYFGKRAIMVNDDKPLIEITESDVIVYGTPWDGKHRLSTDTAVPLKAVCVLERGEENEIAKMKKREVYPVMIEQVYRSENVENMRSTLVLIDKLCEKTALYRLKCNMDIEAAVIAFEGMRG